MINTFRYALLLLLSPSLLQLDYPRPCLRWLHCSPRVLPRKRRPPPQVNRPQLPLKKGGEAAPSGAIKIAFMGPLTGGAAFIGQEQLGFAKAAVQIFNEESGLNVELVEGDDEMNPDTGKTVAKRFAADSEILVVVGPAGSQICESTQPIFAEAGLAHITPSCPRTDLTQSGTPTFFRPIPTDADQSVTDGTYMVDELGVQSDYLLDAQSSYSVGLNDELEAVRNERGVTAIERSSVSQDEGDFSSLVTPMSFFPPARLRSRWRRAQFNCANRVSSCASWRAFSTLRCWRLGSTSWSVMLGCWIWVISPSLGWPAMATPISPLIL